jgi:hypothetical protein
MYGEVLNIFIYQRDANHIEISSHPHRMTIIKSPQNNKCWIGKRNPYTSLMKCKLAQPLWKIVWWVLKIKTKDRTSIPFSYTTPRYISKGIKVSIHKKILYAHILFTV